MPHRLLSLKPDADRANWDRTISIHRLAASAIFTIFIVAIFSGFSFKAEENIAFSVILVLLLGMPHGAMDVAVAAMRASRNTVGFHLAFILRYVGLAALVVFVWWLYPAMSLAIFLMISALHFSEDWDADLGRWQRASIGLALLCFPALMNEQGLSELFAWLVPSADALMIAHAQHWIALIMAPIALGIITRNARYKSLASAEIALVLTLAVVATPLTFFLLYFCGLHSIRHLLRTSRSLGYRSVGSALMIGLPYALAASLSIIGFALFGLSSPIDASLFMALFVGLAALTVPHMVL